MGCATPVIGSNVGGIKHSVVDGSTGYLIPPNDPAALSDRLALLYEDRALRESMGQAAKTRANSYFTWARVAHGLSKVYKKVINPVPAYAERIYSPSVGTQIIGSTA
jgi:D-inositol-3-phosphate glycosyltransferase